MKNLILIVSVLSLLHTSIQAQNVGDTIVIESFNYTQTYGINQWSGGIRDTIIDFSVLPNQPIEKVLMLYNMRCKNNLVSNSQNKDQGCGEWDASCNTYLHDSTRTDSVTYFHPNYIISNFDGTSFDYTSQEVYDLYLYEENIVTLNNIISENSYNILNGNSNSSTTLSGSNNSGKSQYLYTAAELTAAGFSAGEIDGILLHANNTGNINFFRVKLKTTTETELGPYNPVIDGLTEVFFHNQFTFQNGGNRLQFDTPFDWNGTDNLIVEFSFTNSIPTNDIQLKATPSNSLGIYTNNDYHINTTFGGHIEVPTDNLTNILEEITVSFWSYGETDILPANTFCLEAVDTNNNRTLSTHLPWGNSKIIFDCGNTGGSYDRITKTAVENEFEGQWNHWAFTKNTNTGVMRIFLNGNEWLSGSDKTKEIHIDKLIVGANKNGDISYKGFIDELRIWDKELTATEINDWRNVSINSAHPYYSNLKAYLKLDEGNGTIIGDEFNNNISATGNSPHFWKYSRGNKISRFFKADNNRPNITLLQGEYDISINQISVYDSIARQPNMVKNYTIAQNIGTLLDDEVELDSETFLWEATEQKVYNATTGTVLSSNTIASEGSYTINDLEYLKRWPAKIEIMSFVTPYGLGLNLGPKGKTWTFDMTDFLPIFNGQKRMTMERGGQWMEDMDIKFLFILGTPPRNVIGFNQIWRPESRSYVQLESDRFFAPRETKLNPQGKHFKIRSSITGHGQEGEFIARQHYININGGDSEFNWQVWKECADNPIYPQGGTWIYDRAGWCPGSPTDVQHYDITSLVTAGENTTIDYGVLNASGTSNYIINNQLITYGDINHELDASIVEVREPSNRVEFSRFNSICHEPQVVIKNTGKTTITSLVIKYWINNSTNPLTYNWSGNLKFDETEIVSLPSPLSLWTTVNASGNIFYASVESPNGENDEYEHNNTYRSKFKIPEVLPENIVVYFKTNNAGAESSYEIKDSEGNIIMSRDGMSNNTTYRDTVNLTYGCYTFLVKDTDDDGIDFWANNDQIGQCRILKDGGGLVKNFDGDFGDNINFEFTVGSPLKYEDLLLNNKISIYPNPAKTSFTIEAENIQNSSIVIYDNLSRKVDLPFKKSNNKIELNSSFLPKGLYIIQIEDLETIHTQKIIID